MVRAKVLKRGLACSKFGNLESPFCFVLSAEAQVIAYPVEGVSFEPVPKRFRRAHLIENFRVGHQQ